MIGIMITTAHAEEGFLKVTTHGTVIEQSNGLLLEIQGMLYEVDSIPYKKLQVLNLHPGSRVLVGIWLNKENKIARMYIIEII